jgi:NAD(P)H-dependent FMN reductase
MPNILVVTGSVRPNSVNEKVVPLVVSEVDTQGATVTVANLKELNLPFFDAPHSPTAPDFEPTHESVKAWTKLVADADGVIFVTPEYNHTLAPVQLNAIDWIGKEWTDKHIGLVGYGWTSGGGQAHAAAREAFEAVLNAHVASKQTNLFFMKDINTDGTLIEEDAVKGKIAATVEELLAEL